MIFSLKNQNLIDIKLEGDAHYYFLHHCHLQGLILLDLNPHEIVLSVRASLSQNKRVYFFGSLFNWELYLGEEQKASLNHLFYSQGVLLVLPSLKKRFHPSLELASLMFEDLEGFAKALKNNI